jgi:hypothetical protein
MGNAQNNIPQAPMLALHTNRQVANSQIVDCLTAIASLTNSLRVASSIPDPEGTGHDVPALDGGVRMSIEVTIRNVCDRLDALMQADARWELPKDDVHTAGMKFMTQQVIEQQQRIQATQMELGELKQRLADQTDVMRETLIRSMEQTLVAQKARLDKLNSEVPPSPEDAPQQ